MQTALENPGLVSLAAGFVDQQSLPVEIVARAAASCWATRSRAGGHFSTERPLATEAASAPDRISGTERGPCPKGSYKEAMPRTVVTTGSAQLIYLVCEALLDPGDIVLVESPTYFVFLGPLETRGAGRSGSRSTRAGSGSIDWRRRSRSWKARAARAGQADLHDPRARQPDRDQPGRRAPEAAGRAGEAVVEERTGFSCWRTPPTAVCRSEPAEPPSVWSHDREGETVILARTFSKTFSPGLKIGYGVLPEGLIDPILSLKATTTSARRTSISGCSSRCWPTGATTAMWRELNGLYRRKCDVFLEAPRGTRGADRFGGPLDSPAGRAFRLDDRARRTRYRVSTDRCFRSACTRE